MASEIKVDTISEKTSTNGVTIDSLSIKDGGLVAEGNIDVNGNNLVLDANANTYLDAGTDDTIKIYVAGAHDATISANAINVLSGTTLTIDSGATITNSGTANGFGSSDPSSADGDTLGTSSAEWSDLYLADGGIVYFGNDQDIKLTHNADKGLILKHAATADDKPVILTLQTGETDLAADDVIGKIEFQAPDEGTGTDAILVSGAIQAVAEANHSSSSNATRLEFMTGSSEAATSQMTVSSGGILGVGAGVPGDLGVGIHVKTADSGQGSVHAGGDELVLENNGACGLSIIAEGNAGYVFFGDAASNNIGSIAYDNDNNAMLFTTNAAEGARLSSSGVFLVGCTSDSLGSKGIAFLGEFANGSYFTHDAQDSGGAGLIINRLNNDGPMLKLFQATAQEGVISVSGSTVSYGTFTGVHWSQLSDNSKPEIFRGTVMESINSLCEWYQAQFTVVATEDTEEYVMKESIALPDGKSVGDTTPYTYKGIDYTATIIKETNSTLPKSKVSDTEDSKAVYGVFSHWDGPDAENFENDFNVASLGTFVIRVHSGETVAIGDYLQSKGDGTAKVQADDIMRASTIAKVTSTVKQETYADDSYTVPCTLHCG